MVPTKFELKIVVDLEKKETRVSKAVNPLFDLRILAEGMGVLMGQASEYTGKTKLDIYWQIIELLEEVKNDYEKTSQEVERSTTPWEKFKFIISKIKIFLFNRNEKENTKK
jgi:hypothetical protein